MVYLMKPCLARAVLKGRRMKAEQNSIFVESLTERDTAPQFVPMKTAHIRAKAVALSLHRP